MAIFQCDLLKNSKNRCIASLRNYFLCFSEGKRTSIMGQVIYFLSLILLRAGSSRYVIDCPVSVVTFMPPLFLRNVREYKDRSLSNKK